MSKKLTRAWPIFLLLALTFFLRIIKIEQLFYFTYDEAIPAFVARRLILWHHIPLIGGVTPFGFHLAPYFYWFYALLLFIGKLNPIIWGFAGALFAAATTFLIYKAGETLGSKKIGFLAVAFWTFSYLTNLYDRHLWALYWGPLISLLVLLSLHKIISSTVIARPTSVIPAKAGIQSKIVTRYTRILGITLALGIHADPSNLVFLLLSVIVWFIYKIPIKKSTLIAISVILLSFLPLLIFDLRHNFANSKPVLQYIKTPRNNSGFELQRFVDNSLLFPRTLARTVYTFGDNQTAKQYSYCKSFIQEKFNAIPGIFQVTSSIILIYFFVASAKSKNKLSKLISILITLYFLGVQVYGTIFKDDIFEHYITGILASYGLILAFLLSKLPKKVWLLLLGIFISINLYKLTNAQNNLGLTAKREAIEYTMRQVGDKPFSLDSLSTCWKLNGYRYLFVVFGREPVKSYVDPNLAFLYGTTPVADKHPATVVTFVVHDFVPETEDFYKRYARLKSHELSSAIFGNIEVIIMDNSSNWFDQPTELKNPNLPISID